jgi:hypothetical protein
MMHRLTFADLMILASVALIIALSIRKPRRPPRNPRHPVPAHEQFEHFLRIKRRAGEIFRF